MIKKLFDLQDLRFRDFVSKLIPNIDKEEIIGIRVPILRKFFKENISLFDKNFLENLPHKYLEENLLHIYFLNSIKDFEEAVFQTEKFLPFINNWSVSDSFNPKIFQKNKDKIYEKIIFWLEKEDIYIKRASIYFLMKNFLDEDFKLEIFDKILKINSKDYYLDMIISRFFAESLAKKYDEAIEVLESKKLSKFIQNKTIQKAVESRKIDLETKEYLKTLKIK